jgi:hypothetical protein
MNNGCITCREIVAKKLSSPRDVVIFIKKLIIIIKTPDITENGGFDYQTTPVDP